MRPNLLMTIILPQLIWTGNANHNIEYRTIFPGENQLLVSHHQSDRMIGNIPTPRGYHRVDFGEKSFSTWLRSIHLKKDGRVFLYNGVLKSNQSAQFAVLDIPVGKKDLQQCADAVIRLRAQFLLDSKRFDEISFADNNGKQYRFMASGSELFENYLEKVYAYCGTLSLERQLEKVAQITDMQPGDVLIKGGSPGHAVIVADLAVNSSGQKIFLLAQSYMPAQDIHILNNPMSPELSPWYELNDNSLIYTPEWVFRPEHLKKWPERGKF